LGLVAPVHTAIALFVKPTSTAIKTTAGASYVDYKYDDSLVRAFSVSERVLFLEFKNGKLNGFFCGVHSTKTRPMST